MNMPHDPRLWPRVYVDKLTNKIVAVTVVGDDQSVTTRRFDPGLEDEALAYAARICVRNGTLLSTLPRKK